MNPFGFLQNLGKSLAEYFSPALSSVKSIFDTLIPGQKAAAMNSSPAPTINIPTPTPSPTPAMPSADTFNQGFANFGANVPAATQGAEFAKTAGQLPPNIDQLLPSILALMETGGGQNMVANNNLFNIKGIQDGNSQFVNYPDFATSLWEVKMAQIPHRDFSDFF